MLRPSYAKGSVVLTPASHVKGLRPASRDWDRWESVRELDHDEFENGHSGNGSWGHDEDDGGDNRGSGKEQPKGNAKNGGKEISEAQVSADVKQGGPRVRDEIQEEVDAVVKKNSSLVRSDFDGRVFQYLHAIHGIGGREKVRSTLEKLHLSTLDKQRSSINKWPAYLVALLKKMFNDLTAERKAEQKRAKVEAAEYGKQLSLSVDALFQKPVEVKVLVQNPQENPQEADRAEETEQKWLERGGDVLLTALGHSPKSASPSGTPPGMLNKPPHAFRSIPPGFTPPESPAHDAHPHGSPPSTAPSGMHEAPAIFRSIPPGFTPPQIDSPTHDTHSAACRSSEPPPTPQQFVSGSSEPPPTPQQFVSGSTCSPPEKLFPPKPPPTPPQQRSAALAPAMPPQLRSSPPPLPSQPPPPPPPTTAYQAPEPHRQGPPGLSATAYQASEPHRQGPPGIFQQRQGPPVMTSPLASPPAGYVHQRQQPAVPPPPPPAAFHGNDRYTTSARITDSVLCSQEPPGLTPPPHPPQPQQPLPPSVTLAPAGPGNDHQVPHQQQQPRVVPPRHKPQSQVNGVHAPPAATRPSPQTDERSQLSRPPPPPTEPPTQPDKKVFHDSPWGITNPLVLF